MNLKKIIFITLFLVAGYYTLAFIAGNQIATHMGACTKQLNSFNRLKVAKTDSEKREIMLSMINCIDKKITFPANLYFNKEKISANITEVRKI
jgi:hypothetical protein